MRYVQTTIHVKELARSIRFYEDFIGLKQTRRFDAGPGEIVFLANGAGETAVELIFMPQNGPCTRQGISIGFETDDLMRDLACAKARGWDPGEVQQPNPRTKFFFVNDPDGVCVQLVQFE